MPPGSWTVVARAGETAVLAPLLPRDGRVGRADMTPDSVVTVLLHSPERQFREVQANVVPLVLPGVPAEQGRRLYVARVEVATGTIHFAPPAAGPELVRSPADPSAVTFEEANALWALGEDGGVLRLTSERVAGFARAELAARQREGEVILYWATAPVWSPDGSLIAYASNREAVATGSGGQSIWLVEPTSGRERALLWEPGRSYRPIGWLDGELLVISDQPGIWSVHPASGAVTEVALATHIAVADDGSALVIAEGVPEVTAVRVLSSGAWSTIPAPPDGFRYSPQALFSPTARRLLLEATRAGGTDRRFLVYDRESGELREVEGSGRELKGWPTWLDDETVYSYQLSAISYKTVEKVGVLHTTLRLSRESGNPASFVRLRSSQTPLMKDTGSPLSRGRRSFSTDFYRLSAIRSRDGRGWSLGGGSSRRGVS